MIRRLAALAFWGIVALFALGQLPPPLIGEALYLVVAVLAWPVKVLGPVYGATTVAVVLGVGLASLLAGFVHDAVLDEDRRATIGKANETYQRRKWLPW